MIQCVILILSSLFWYDHVLQAFVPHNMFQPYNVLVKGQRPPLNKMQVVIRYEGSFHTKGFMGDDDCGTTTSEQSKGNVLQLWQKEQDALAAFKGFSPTSAIGKMAQRLNIDDDNTRHGIFVPCGDLQMYANILCGVQWRIPYNITLAAYIPYRSVSLKNVHWKEYRDGVTYEDQTAPDLIKEIESLGGMKLGGWNRHGFGDLMVQGEYYRHFIQNKPWLKNVGLEIRGGILFPTGLKEDPDKLLGLPLGYDSGFGFLFAGKLELWFIHNILFGLDVELLDLFGNTHCRRIKIDRAQTDLLLMKKVSAFKDPGFIEQFTFYLQKMYLWRGLSARCAYQYAKRHEDKLYVCSHDYDMHVVNDAESLQEWTTHSMVFDAKYEWYTHPSHRIKPALSLFVKWGFNGKRAVVANTLGLTFDLAW